MVRARVELAERSGVLTVPHRTVLYDGEQAFLYTLQDGVAHRVEVTVGQDDSDRIEIEAGLAAGVEVVDGNYELADGMAGSRSDASWGKRSPHCAPALSGRVSRGAPGEPLRGTSGYACQEGAPA